MWTAGAGQGGERAACYMDSTYNTGRGAMICFRGESFLIITMLL